MAVSATPYGLALQSLVEGRIRLGTDPLMCMICTAGYTPNPNSHKFKNSVTNEIVGSGYTAQQVTGLGSSYTTVDKTLRVAAGNMLWPSVTWTGAKWGVLYLAPTGAPATAQPLLGYVDFGTAQDRADAPFYINWPGGTLIKLALPA